MRRPSFFALLLLPLLSLLYACAANRYPASGGPRYGVQDDYPISKDALGTPLITESLFDYKERTLSEEDIRRILDGRIAIRDTVRLAIFNFGGTMAKYSPWRWSDEESLKTQQQLIDTLTYVLRQSQKVHQVILLPSMVTGNRPNIHQLRESAVRTQADVLLVFSLYSDLFQKYRVFKKDEAKAFATSEAILMDVRTGIIPHTSVVTRSAQSIKEQSDFAPEELQKRALQTATLEALLETGRQAAAFLK